MKDGYINVGAEMTKDLERKARILAARLGLSRSEFFRQALAFYIEKLEKEEITNDSSTNGDKK